jgi:hypothetical protein
MVDHARKRPDRVNAIGAAPYVISRSVIAAVKATLVKEMLMMVRRESPGSLIEGLAQSGLRCDDMYVLQLLRGGAHGDGS